MIQNNYESESLKEVWNWKEQIYEEHKNEVIEDMINSILKEAKEVSERLSLKNKKEKTA